MIDEEEIANIVRLFAGLGDSLAIDVLLSNAKDAIDKGRKDLATHLLDLSERFFKLRIEAEEAGEDIEGLRVISFSLRIVAHRLHKEYNTLADDSRLLRLVAEVP